MRKLLCGVIAASIVGAVTAFVVYKARQKKCA